MTPEQALRAGAARAYADILGRRHPDLAVKVRVECDGYEVVRAARSRPGEVGRLEPGRHKANPALNRAASLPDPHHAERAA